MSHTPRVSVLVPVYNAEKYLAACLESILAQHFTDFELVCCNDGSKDSSLQILQDYAAKDPRVKALTWENGGSGAVRNKLLGAACGKYIVFVDADDWLTADALQELVAAAEQSDADMVRCLFTQVDEDGTQRSCLDLYDDYKKPVPSRDPASRFQAALDDSNVWGKIIRREFIVRNQLKFLEKGLLEDVSFEVLLYWLAGKIEFLQKELFFYRRFDGSFSSSADRMLLGTLNNFIYLVQSIERHGLASPDTYGLALMQVVRRMSRLRRISPSCQAQAQDALQRGLAVLAQYKDHCKPGVRGRMKFLLWVTRHASFQATCFWARILR